MSMDSRGFPEPPASPGGVPGAFVLGADARAMEAGAVTDAAHRITDAEGRTYRVRRYAPSDRGALQAMYEAFEPKRVAQGLPPADAEGVARWLERVLPRGEHVVVDSDGRIVGHAMLIPMEDGGAELANFLCRSVRGRGVGTALNRVVLALAREAGYRRVWLSVEPWNRAAVRSYLKAGFRPLAGVSVGAEIEMEATLDPPAGG